MRKDTLKLKQEREGKQFTNKNGTKFIIIEYNSADSVLIEFCDEYKYKFYTTYNVCKEGNVKNPYDKTVCNNMGCLGLMKDGSKPKATEKGKHSREYDLWSSMLQRCYSDKFHERNPTYKDCTVCDRWLVFANFIEDLPLIEGYELWRDNPNTGVSLDKDSKVKGNKVYSLDTVKFMSKSDNTKEQVERCGSSFINDINRKPPKKVMAISLTETKVLVFKSMRQAEKFGFNHSNISVCCNGERKTHKGYKWKYID